MRPIKARAAVAVATIAAAGTLGFPLLGAARDDPGLSQPDPGGSSSTTAAGPVVETSVAEPSTSAVDSTIADTTTIVPNETTTTLLPPPVIVAAVGDLSCESTRPTTPTQCHAAAVSDALVAITDLHDFLALGDLQYITGSLTEFQRSYDARPTGASRTTPARRSGTTST